jgi:hypothetical protein
MSNPHVQVALTYVRRPFTSFRGWLTAIFCVFLPIPWLVRSMLGGPIEIPHVPMAPVLVPFLFLFAFLAVHIKGQFVNPRAHLIPGYRRVHLGAAAVAALLCAVVLPSLLACVLNWYLRHDSPLALALADHTDEELWTITHATRATLQASLTPFDPIGLVAIAIFLFGLAMWATLIDAMWIFPASAVAFAAIVGVDSGTACFRQLMFGQYEPAAIFGLGALMTVLAGIRLLRLNEETLGYHATLSVQERTRMTGQSSGQQRRFLPGLSDWIREREVTRIVRHAGRASRSWWSRTCRWQAGMVVGWPLWFWVLGTLVFLHILTQWVLIKPTDPMAVMMYTSVLLTLLPAVIAAAYVFQWGPLKLGSDFLLPVDRRSYIKQVGMAAALGHLQLWGGLSAALAIWWLLVSPLPIPPSMLAGVLAISAAYQLGVFGAVAWTARYRSWQLVGFVITVLFLPAQCSQAFWMTHWLDSPPAGLSYESLEIAGIMAAFGLVATFDAYRRWLATDLG